MTGHLKKILPLTAAFAPAKLFACATCFGGNIDSPMADGMNWGIFTLLAVVGLVLLAFLAFFIHIIRKGETAVAENNLQTSKT